ncbi:hypothetical protein Hanom_Chr07g00619861 [Helianthus anomalus]
MIGYEFRERMREVNLLWAEQDSLFIDRLLCLREPCANLYLLVLVSLSSLDVACRVNLATLGKIQVSVPRGHLYVF